MRLLLDIGNTRIKWALQTDAGLSEQQAIAHAGLSAAQLTQAFLSLGNVTSMLVANVAGAELAQKLGQVARDCWQLQARFVSAAAQASIHGRLIRNAYLQPQQLGVDRWLGLLGAAALHPGAALVVSVGTAMTLDALDTQGRHLGGLIVPGPMLMQRSLLQHTSDLAERAMRQIPQQAAQFFANNTRDAIEQGARHAAVSLIAAARQQLHGAAPQVLLTGGGADFLSSLLSFPVRIVPDLVLQGLAQVGEAAPGAAGV